MNLLQASLAALCIALSSCASAPSTAENAVPPAPVEVTPRAIQKTTHLYATKQGQQLHLDRYVPQDLQRQDRLPAIIYSVGGGWENGDRGDRVSQEFLEHFVARGYIGISIDYRLGIRQAKQSGEMTPANTRQMYLRAIRWGVEDLYDATAYVLKHADELNVDPTRVVIVGSSAGATNSLVAEFNLANQTPLARAHLPEDFRYAGVISIAGSFWLEDNTPFAWQRSPAAVMFVHGAKDQLVTYDADEKSSAYGPVYAQKQFETQGHSSWFIDLPQADHVMAFAGLIDYRSEMEAFMTKLVWGKQQLTVHTVENGKVPKTLGNLAVLYRRYLPPQVQQQLDAMKQ